MDGVIYDDGNLKLIPGDDGTIGIETAEGDDLGFFLAEEVEHLRDALSRWLIRRAVQEALAERGDDGR